MLQISVHLSILAELTDFFTSLRCPGAELRILRKYSQLEMKLTVLIKDINGDKIALSLKFPEEQSMAYSR